MIVEFWCCVCRTPLGKIDTETIHLPLSLDQIQPIRPGGVKPWPPQLPDPKDWWCPQCQKKPFGPGRMYTNQGWVTVLDEVVFNALYNCCEQPEDPKTREKMKDHYDTFLRELAVPMSEEQAKGATRINGLLEEVITAEDIAAIKDAMVPSHIGPTLFAPGNPPIIAPIEKKTMDQMKREFPNDLACSKCGKVCKNKIGLLSHERHCKK